MHAPHWINRRGKLHGNYSLPRRIGTVQKKRKKEKVACNQAELRVITFFEQAGVDKEDEKAADRRSGQCPRNSGQLHPGAGRLVADRDSRAAGETHSTSAHRHALAHTLPAKFSMHSLRA